MGENLFDCAPASRSDDCSSLAQPDPVSEPLADETELFLVRRNLEKRAPERARSELPADRAAKLFAAHRSRCFALNRHYVCAAGRVSACDRDSIEMGPDSRLGMGV